uniref:G-protein coupled receptors family 1 profile domain-containing protein n=1 Tax=Sinocyclocheilus rhinocerous TaxID=307959 RepID=A0A673K0W2_9TELE
PELSRAPLSRSSRFYGGFSGMGVTIFLLFVYIISLLGNSCLMFVIIIIDRNLHTPKYIAVFNLSLTDICESTAVIPQLLDTFLFGNQLIPYGLCMSNICKG